MGLISHRTLLLVCFCAVVIYAEDCPDKCSCKRNTQKDGADWIKIRCGDVVKLNIFAEEEFQNWAHEVVQL